MYMQIEAKLGDKDWFFKIEDILPHIVNQLWISDISNSF